jgi:archaemetzincin
VGEQGGETTAWLAGDLRDTLGTAVAVLDPVEIPPESYDARRRQFNSTRILKEILLDVPGDALRIQGIEEHDLCIPILTYVFGEAQLGGTASVVSTARLRQEFHGLPPDEPLFLRRLHKESLHELGHNFGLVHCHDRGCVMYLSNTIMDVDAKGDDLCVHCRKAVHSNIGGGR